MAPAPELDQQKKMLEIKELKATQKHLMREKSLSIEKQYSAKTIAIQTEIMVGSDKVNERVMDMLGKRYNSGPLAKRLQHKDDEVTCKLLRRKLNKSISSKKKYMNFWKICKEDLEM